MFERKAKTMSVLLKRDVQEASMLEKIISPGDKVEMIAAQKVLLPDGTEGTSRYMTTVNDVLEANLIEIIMPMEKTKLVLLPVDGEYNVCFFSNSSMYCGRIRVVDRQKKDNTYVFIAEMISGLAKSQRREYYRFHCVLETQTKQITESEAQAIGKNLAYLISPDDMNKGVIVDISGGGLRFVSKKAYEKDQLVLLKFELPFGKETKTFSLASKVVMSGKVERQSTEYENRVQFLFIENTTREEIIKYIFEEERKNRKNGKR